MANVDIEVNGRAYRLICENGQETRIRELAAYVESRLQAITGGRSGSDAHMLLATCIVLADELQEVVAGRSELVQRGLVSGGEIRIPLADAEMMAATVEQLADRIEEVAERIERA